jgi:hypothetical protein
VDSHRCMRGREKKIANRTTHYVGPSPAYIHPRGASSGTRETRDDRMWNIYGNSDRRRSLNLELGLGGLARICQKAENITSLDDETKIWDLIVVKL